VHLAVEGDRDEPGGRRVEAVDELRRQRFDEGALVFGQGGDEPRDRLFVATARRRQREARRLVEDRETVAQVDQPGLGKAQWRSPQTK